MPTTTGQSACGREEFVKLITCNETIRKRCFVKISACGSWEDLTKFITCNKIKGTSFCEKRRLWQLGRPQQAYNMSQNPRNVSFARPEAPAAAGKTSPTSLHVMQHIRNFLQRRTTRRLGGRVRGVGALACRWVCKSGGLGSQGGNRLNCN